MRCEEGYVPRTTDGSGRRGPHPYRESSNLGAQEAKGPRDAFTRPGGNLFFHP